MTQPENADYLEFLAVLKAAGYEYGEDAAGNAYTGWCLARQQRPDPRIVEAVLVHAGNQWPRELTSGVMFYKGLRITLAEFLAAGGKV
jgi:hypothetical protein